VFDSIVDPTIGPAADAGREPVVLAERPASLSGLRLGLLANTKRNAEQFLDQVGKLLAAHYGVRTVLAAKRHPTGSRRARTSRPSGTCRSRRVLPETWPVGGS
jgi:hypothetical protein